MDDEDERNLLYKLCCSRPRPADPKLAKYRLRYFDIRGLGEPIRMIFHYAQVPFEDVRISQDEWSDLKSSTRYGKLPELEVEGKKLAESMSIARFLGNKFGLGGSDEWQKQKIDEISDIQKDLAHELSSFIGTALGMREGDKKALRKELYLPTIRRYLPTYVRMLDESGSGFLISSGPTWVDFFVEEYLTTLNNVDPKLFKKYPKLAEYVERVQHLPQLRSYMSTRQSSVV
ncbi:putative glutathione S-transferase 8 [Ditylenchus destructor]|uniref:glutathione transferase n=1 Tax=Ditylenchus destructor TaxID=166010 RepID=A0AAD4R5M6_9BILA|nr:putative glutathione S-transferase 8 [Ditylenchus destructor]